MSRRWTEAEFAEVQRRGSALIQPVSPKGKYGNTKIAYQGMMFDSKHELERWKEFELQRVSGAIRSVVRQVSMPLQGSTQRIRIDFLVIECDGRHNWYDAKGFETAAWRGKRRQVLEAYGIEVKLI